MPIIGSDGRTIYYTREPKACTALNLRPDPAARRGFAGDLLRRLRRRLRRRCRFTPAASGPEAAEFDTSSSSIRPESLLGYFCSPAVSRLHE